MHKLARFLAATYATAAFVMLLWPFLPCVVIAFWYFVYTDKPIGKISALDELQTFFKDDGMVWLITLGIVLVAVVLTSLKLLDFIGS